MNRKDKIRAIVQAMIDGGYTHGYQENSIEIDIIVNREITLYAQKEDIFTTVTFEWLLFNSNAMKAAYGSEKKCQYISLDCSNCPEPKMRGENPSNCSYKAYIYHGLYALRLSLLKEDYIDSLYQNLPKETIQDEQT